MRGKFGMSTRQAKNLHRTPVHDDAVHDNRVVSASTARYYHLSNSPANRGRSGTRETRFIARVSRPDATIRETRKRGIGKGVHPDPQRLRKDWSHEAEEGCARDAHRGRVAGRHNWGSGLQRRSGGASAPG
jgi:hypothetical protein